MEGMVAARKLTCPHSSYHPECYKSYDVQYFLGGGVRSRDLRQSLKSRRL